MKRFIISFAFTAFALLTILTPAFTSAAELHLIFYKNTPPSNWFFGTPFVSNYQITLTSKSYKLKTTVNNTWYADYWNIPTGTYTVTVQELGGLYRLAWLRGTGIIEYNLTFLTAKVDLQKNSTIYWGYYEKEDSGIR